MGSGVAFLDIEGDGDQDLVFVNGMDWPEQRRRRRTPRRLYRNRGDGTFEDATRGSGLDFEAQGMGVAAADIDNDGDTDLFLSALGADRVLRNDGKGRFTDVTAAVGHRGVGLLDQRRLPRLRQGRRRRPLRLQLRALDARHRHPLHADGARSPTARRSRTRARSSRLYRNDGSGAFHGRHARRPGSRTTNGKALGVAVLDYDRDGWPDLAVAHDTQPNRLYRNLGNGDLRGARAVARGSPSTRAGAPAARWASTPPTTTAADSRAS